MTKIIPDGAWGPGYESDSVVDAIQKKMDANVKSMLDYLNVKMYVTTGKPYPPQEAYSNFKTNYNTYGTLSLKDLQFIATNHITSKYKNAIVELVPEPNSYIATLSVILPVYVLHDVGPDKVTYQKQYVQSAGMFDKAYIYQTNVDVISYTLNKLLDTLDLHLSKMSSKIPTPLGVQPYILDAPVKNSTYVAPYFPHTKWWE
jgi:hypothetical protein